MNDGVKEAAFLVRAHPDLSSWGGGQSPAARVTVRQRWREVSALVFGFSPKISTPVENIVEKQVKRLGCRWKCLIYRVFSPGEGR